MIADGIVEAAVVDATFEMNVETADERVIERKDRNAVVATGIAVGAGDG